MLRKFSASVKLYMLIFITAASLVVLGFFGIENVKRMDENTHSLYADRVVPIQQLSNIRFEYSVEILPLAQKVKDRLLTYNEAKERLKRAQSIINANWRNYKLTYLTPQEALLVKQAEVIKKHADERSVALLLILSKPNAQALDAYIQKQSNIEKDAFFTKLSQLMDLQVLVGSDILNTNNKIYQATSNRFLFLIALSLIIALSLSLMIVKNINTLIRSISQNNNTIKESEERYRSLFEQASDAIYVVNYKGEFTQVNDSMCKMLGYSRQELLKMKVEQLVNAELIKANPFVYAKAKPGDSVIGERKAIHKDGHIIDIEINGKKFDDNRVLVILRDITTRKQMEAELIKAELRFRTLADRSMVGIYIVQQGKFVYVNPRFAEVFGYGPADLIGKAPVEAIIHPDYQSISNENVRLRVDDDVDSVHYEAMGKRKDGSANWIEFYGSRAVIENEPTIIGSMIDITERKTAEYELKRSEQKYKLLFESNPLPLWIVAKDDLSVMAANDAAAKLYGYAPDELLQMDIKKLRPADTWEKLINNYKQHIPDATDFGIVDHLKRDGTTVMVGIIAQDIIFEGRQARITSTNDVTEKLKAEDLLKTTEANLQTILNSTSTAYALLDRELNVLEYNNKALLFAKREFNFDPQSGGKLLDNLSQSRQLQLFEYISDVFKGKTISYEVNYPQFDESSIWYHIRMFPISDKEGEILGLVLGIDDITEEKIAEQSLQSAYESIKGHVTFIKEMIWRQSHILRSPLANLKGLVSILQNDPADKEVLEYIEIELDRIDKVFIETVEDSTKDEMNIYTG
jgi:two-component system, sporulation sensor kinase E